MIPVIQEKSQEQIRFENTCCKVLMGEFRNCPFGSIGMVIHYLYAYGCIDYDRVQIGDGKVQLWGKTVASFEFDNDLNMPTFAFDESLGYNINENQRCYLRGLKENWNNPYTKYQNKQ